MPNNLRLSIDRQSEIFAMLQYQATETFYQFNQVSITPGTVYIVGRQQLLDNLDRVRALCDDPTVIMIFNNSAEGSWTITSQLKQLKIEPLIKTKKLLLVAGAEAMEGLPCLTHEHFLTKILDFDETLDAQQHTNEIFAKVHKPYKFLFLNGRARSHRKYLYERLRQLGLLDRALYTMLEAKPCVVGPFDLHAGDINLMATPTVLQRLPDGYEVPRYRDPVFGPIVPDRSFLKQELFRQEWGEIYLYPPPYIDTYFSFVTETICAESTISFRTEKIAKPLAIGHPFIVASTPGYYRDLRRLGFRTFSHLIDESFDSIDHAQTRMERVLTIIQDLCRQDLASWLDACQNICLHNQQHLAEFKREHESRWPRQFADWLLEHSRSKAIV